MPAERFRIGFRSLARNVEVPTPNELAEILSDLPRRGTLKKIAVWSAMLWDSEGQNSLPDCDYAVLAPRTGISSLSRRILNIKVSNANSYFFDDQQLRSLAYYCSQYCHEERTATTNIDVDKLLVACAIVNSLLETNKEPSDKSLDSSHQWKEMIRQALLKHRTLLLRWDRYYQFLKSVEQRSTDLGETIGVAFQKHTGFSVDQYSSLNWAYWNRLRHTRSAEVIADAVVPIQAENCPPNLLLWMQAHSLSTRKEPPVVPLSASAWGASSRQPLADLKPGWLPASKYALEELMGIGQLFAAIDALWGRTGAFPDLLTSAFGDFLEKRLRSMAERLCAGRAAVFGDDILDGVGKSSDIIIVSDKVVFLIEVVSSRFPLAILDSHVDSIDFPSTLKNAIGKKIAQLAKNMRWVARGDYHKSGILSAPLGEYIFRPVLLTIYDLFASDQFEKVFKTEELQVETLQVEPIQFLSADDIEFADLLTNPADGFELLMRILTRKRETSGSDFLANARLEYDIKERMVELMKRIDGLIMTYA